MWHENNIKIFILHPEYKPSDKSVFINCLKNTGVLVTRNGDLFGDLILLSDIKVIESYKNYAKYGEKTAKIV